MNKGIWKSTFLSPQIRAGTREFPLENSREFPVKFISHPFPRIFSVSREISGNFYVLWVKNSSISLIFEYFCLGLESNFTVENDNIQAENHCNSPKKCIFSQNGMIFINYTVNLHFSRNSREFPRKFWEFPFSRNENKVGNSQPYLRFTQKCSNLSKPWWDPAFTPRKLLEWL